MQQNILKESDVTKIFLTYVENGSKKKFQVKLRYMDTKVSYFAAAIPVTFVKPKKKTNVELKVFTSDGIYCAKVTLVDSTMSLNEVLFEVSLPKSWNFIQMRAGLRKPCELPVTLKFNDGFTISAKSYDLSVGGVSFLLKEELPRIYKEVSGILTLELPKSEIINFPEGKMIVEARFVRQKKILVDYYDENLYIYKFLTVSPEDLEVLKHYLIKLS